MPFFPAGDRPDSRVDVFIPAQGDALSVLRRAMSPPHFPIGPDELNGRWSFNSLETGEHRIEGFSVLAAEIPHKGGLTFGYRVSDGHSTIAYMSDHCPTELGPGADGLGAHHQAALALAHHADVLIHDAHYLNAELPARAHYGHSAVGYAVGLAVAAEARRVVLFHHNPSRTDDEIDIILADARAGEPPVIVDVAAEGMEIDLRAM
jgi:phosphoribosyl 1,2-cyclic phosphodiesterase